jgi:hypothetical protein
VSVASWPQGTPSLNRLRKQQDSKLTAASADDISQLNPPSVQDQSDEHSGVESCRCACHCCALDRRCCSTAFLPNGSGLALCLTHGPLLLSRGDSYLKAALSALKTGPNLLNSPLLIEPPIISTAHLQRGVHKAQVAGVGQAAGLHAAGAPRRPSPRQLCQRPVEIAETRVLQQMPTSANTSTHGHMQGG